MKNLYRTLAAVSLSLIIGCSTSRPLVKQEVLMTKYNRPLDGYWLTEAAYQELFAFEDSEFSYTSEPPVSALIKSASRYSRKNLFKQADKGQDRLLTLEELLPTIEQTKKEIIETPTRFRVDAYNTQIRDYWVTDAAYQSYVEWFHQTNPSESEIIKLFETADTNPKDRRLDYNELQSTLLKSLKEKKK
ncbi:MAG: hypothetical protein KJ879_01815 [Nanoarchaeota archaeon]|nr:hypothetical protein [Nanoarchaeota archaeon]